MRKSSKKSIEKLWRGQKEEGIVEKVKKASGKEVGLKLKKLASFLVVNFNGNSYSNNDNISNISISSK